MFKSKLHKVTKETISKRENIYRWFKINASHQKLKIAKIDRFMFVAKLIAAAACVFLVFALFT